MGRVIEGTFRSLNNLLEKLHQSFFFYLLMSTERFVSIGTYLPSAMLVAVNFTFTSIALWIRSGLPGGEVVPGMEGKRMEKEMGRLAVERDLFLPLGVVTVCQALGVVPLWLFNHTPEQVRCHPIVLNNMVLLTHGIDLGSSFCRLPGTQPPSTNSAVCLAPSIPPDHAAIPADPVLLATATRHVPLHPCYAQLLFIPPDRTSRQPAVIRPSRLQVLVATAGSRQSASRAGDSNGLLQARQSRRYRRRLEGGRIWMACYGHVHSCGGVVCVVAGMAGRKFGCCRSAFCWESEDGLKLASSVFITVA